MSLIDLPTAKAHLRVDADYPDEQVSIYLNAAERAVAEFLNRRIYATQQELDTAIEDVPAALTAASEAYETALEAAADIEDATTQEMAKERAERVFAAAKTAARETYDGLVVNDAIKAGILLMAASLHENRGDSVDGAELPRAAQALLFPFRVGLGV